MANGFGKPKFGNKTGIKRFKIKDGDGPDNVYRILPPMKSQEFTGDWFLFFAQHFGYTIPNKQDETKFVPVPFKCIEEKNWKTQMITFPCPECEYVAEQTQRFEDAQKEAERLKLTGEDLVTYLAPLQTWLEAHNLSKQYYMNAMNQQGEFGNLAIGTKAKKALIREIDALRKMGIEPLNLETGAWFQFIRTGKGRYKTDYDCKYVQVAENVNGKLMMSVPPAPLTEAQQEQALQECIDLTEVPRILTSDQIRMLVESGGEPSEVDAILGISQLRDRAEESPRSAKPTPPAAPTRKVEAVSSVIVEREARRSAALAKEATATATASDATDAETEDTEVAAALAAYEALKAKKTKAPKADVRATLPTPASSELSDEEFLARFPDPNRQ